MKPLVYAWPKDRNKDENPYNHLVYRAISEYEVEEFDHKRLSLKGAVILHLHWPDRLLDDKRLWRLKRRFKKLLSAINQLHEGGGKLVWTVHNLQSREIKHPSVADSFLKQFINEVDGFIFLTEESKKIFLQQYSCKPGVKTTVIPHPHYRNTYRAYSLCEARNTLGINESDFVLGFFGKIRTNKGLDRLISVYEQGINKKVTLLLAGGIDKRGMSTVLSRHMESADNTIGFFNHVASEDVGKIICACNVLIFPYQDILNSGSSLLSLSMGRPIIAPNIGSFPELQQRLGRQWVYLYEQPLDALKLQAAIDWARTETDSSEQPDLDYAEPSRVSEQTEAFYKLVLRG